MDVRIASVCLPLAFEPPAALCTRSQAFCGVWVLWLLWFVRTKLMIKLMSETARWGFARICLPPCNKNAACKHHMLKIMHLHNFCAVCATKSVVSPRLGVTCLLRNYSGCNGPVAEPQAPTPPLKTKRTQNFTLVLALHSTCSPFLHHLSSGNSLPMCAFFFCFHDRRIAVVRHPCPFCFACCPMIQKEIFVSASKESNSTSPTYHQ